MFFHADERYPNAILSGAVMALVGLITALLRSA